MQKSLWIERKFVFDLPTGWMPNILERLRGVSPRLRDLTSTLTESQTGQRYEGKWSIKEHIGHLSDLEELHTSRIDDFLQRKKELHAADMSNAKTDAADHSSKSIQKLLNDFSIKRRHFINRLLVLDDETLEFKSKHPRLKQMMRPVDLAFFVAEHDDHHLTIMREIMDHIKK